MITTRFTALLLLSTLAVACGSAAERPDHYSHQVSSANSDNVVNKSAPEEGDDVATGGCELGSARDCRIQLPEVNGVKNCFVGTQVCSDGTWSECLSDEDASELLAAE